MYKRLIYLIISIALLLTSCMRYHNYKGEVFSNFSENIRKEHKDIIKLKLEYTNPSMYFNYTMEKNFDKKVEKDIFNKTRELVQSEVFQKEFFKHFFDRYTVGKGESTGYPHVFIIFYKKGEKAPFVSYVSEKYDSIYDVGDMTTDYIEWKYMDENKETHEIE